MSLLLGAMETAKLVAIFIDVAVVAILLIFLFVGMKKGMLKMGFSLIAGIATLVLAVMTVSPITEMVKQKTTWDDALCERMQPGLQKNIPNALAPISFYDDDGDPETPDILVYKTVDGMQYYDDIFKGSPVGMMNLQKLLKPVVEDALEKEADKVAEGAEVSVVMIDVVTSYLATAILLVVDFVVLCILYRIVLAVIGLLIRKAVKRLYVAHFLDKVLGAVFGLAVGALILLIVITVVQFLSPFPFMETVTPYLQETKLLAFVMDHNFVYDWIMKTIEGNEALSNFYAGLVGSGESGGGEAA